MYKTNINDHGDYRTMVSLSLKGIREQVEPFQSELNEEYYLNWAGLKEEMQAAAVFERYAHLFSREAVDLIQAEFEDAHGTDDQRPVGYLRAFCTLGHVEHSVRTLSDKVATFTAQSRIEMDGEAIPYRSVPVLIRNEPQRERRRRLFEAELVELDKLNAILYERMGRMHDVAAALGFKSYKDMCSKLKGIDYAALEESMEEMLRRTERTYVEGMEELLRSTVGVSLPEAFVYDIGYAFRGQRYDYAFSKEGLSAAFFSTLRGMGIDPDGYGNIKIDSDDRPGKSPRAFCAPVKVPDDIRLVIRPSGGFDDYAAMFHEGGHSWHFGSTRPDLEPEFRYLGDNSVSEAFAFLFDRLVSDANWLRVRLGMNDPSEFVRFSALRRLFFLRRYAAKLVYELKLHAGTLSPEFKEVYRTCLQRCLRFRHSEKRYLEDVDDAFYCAEYLRAWMLDAQLRSALEEEFGEKWFAEPKAGRYLRELWSYGQKYTADELVKTIGYAGLDIDPLVRELDRLASA